MKTGKTPVDEELDEQKKSSLSDEVLLTMIDKFQQHYRRVSSVEDSDLISTDEVFAAFQEFYPQEYTTDTIVALLSEHFGFIWSPDLKKFVWLIKAV
jgi:hypothetical protein